LRAFGNRWRQRLLAEHRLSGIDRGDSRHDVCGSGDAITTASTSGSAISANPSSVARTPLSPVGDRLYPGEVDVGHHGDRCAGGLPVQGTDVIGAHDPVPMTPRRMLI